MIIIYEIFFMKKLTKHYKKTLIFISVFFCFIIFLLFYSFYPILNYSENIEELPWRIFITDRNWKVITDKAMKNWYYKKYSRDVWEKHINIKKYVFSKHLYSNKFINSLIKIEDKNFYNNYWVNVLSKIRAIKDNFLWKRFSWGSTITEQFIKNKYFRWEKRTYLQKLRESILALYFTNKLSKEEILIEYLNNTYFWNNIYWISWALEVYFNKDNLEDLEEQEIVLLLSLLNYPSVEYTWEENFLKYFNKIKNKLNYSFENKNIYLKSFKKKNIELFPFVTKRVLEEVCENKEENFSIIDKSSILSFWLKGEMSERQSGYINCNREIIINSTVDKKLQEYSKKILNNELNNLSWKNVTNWAIFAIKPNTKEILIYQWSRDFNSKVIDWEVDVIRSKRQMWSTVKPFLYLYALENWYNPDDLLIDLISEYNSFQKWKTYITENYSLKEFWLVRFKKALWNSLNNATVRLASELWLEKVYNFYEKYWFEFDFWAEHYWYSLVLWNAEMKLERLVENYSKLLPSSNLSQGERDNMFLLEDILKDPDNRDISFWVNSILNTSIPQAVKTWTSSEFRDNTIVSYSNDLVLGIWVGNNDNSSMIWVTWISGAGTIWHNIIEKAIKLKYITENHPLTPSLLMRGNLEQWEYCLDKNCFRKELIYKKIWKKYYSRILDNYFSKKDIKEKLSKFEKNKLKNMGIYLK